jgi:hypothetical protein
LPLRVTSDKGGIVQVFGIKLKGDYLLVGSIILQGKWLRVRKREKKCKQKGINLYDYSIKLEIEQG